MRFCVWKMGRREVLVREDLRNYPLPWVSFDPEIDGLYCWMCEIGRLTKGARDRRSRFLLQHRRCGFRDVTERVELAA